MHVGAVNAQVFTSPHSSPDLDPEPALLALINAAKTIVTVGIYSITLPAVADALIAAHQRDVTVQVATDATEAKSVTSQVPRLAAAGIPVNVWGSQYHLAHFKLIVVDEKAVALGSFNFSQEAESADYEVMVVMTGVEVTRGGLAGVCSSLIQACYTSGHPLTVSPAT